MKFLHLFADKWVGLVFSVFVVFTLLTTSLAFAQSPSASAVSDMIRVIVQLESPANASDRAFVHGIGGSVLHEYSLVPAMAVEVPEQALRGLSHNPRVVLIEEDMMVQAMAITPVGDITDEYGETWSVANINAKPVHDSGNVGTGVKIGILDSGISNTHPDLNVVGEYDFVNDTETSDDVYGHGTHVAGTACGMLNGFGVVGVAPACNLYDLRVLNDDGVGYTSDIIAAVDWAAVNHLDVINLSLGTTYDPGATAQAAYDAAYEAGVVIVAAAGNSGKSNGRGTNTIYPANYDSVIAVAATDINDVRAYFSSTGENVELAAPGYSVFSSWNDGDSHYDPQPICIEPYGCYKDGSGTSMASPHVAGAAALVIAAGVTDENNNGRVNDEVRNVLQSTAVDLGYVGKDSQYGYGLIDVAEAVAAVVPLPPQAPVADAGEDQTFELLSGESVSITLTGSGSDANNDSLSYYWIGGDIVGTSTGEVYTTTLSTTGTYIYTLIVSDGALSDTDDVTVTINEAAPNQSPIASFTHSEDYLTVDFDASSSSDLDGDSLSYSWTFGDGSTGTGVNSSHTYATAGTYLVTLMVDDGIDIDSISENVTVTALPALPITLDVSVRRAGPNIFADLIWTGTNDASVDIYRNDSTINTVAGNTYSDKIGRSPEPVYIYKICEAGNMDNCSNEVSITF